MPPTDHEDEPPSTDEAMAWVAMLADGIGPRRPTSPAERKAAEGAVARLGEGGVEAALEPFRGYSSFGHPFLLALLAAVAPAVAGRRHRLRAGLAGLAAGLLLTEGSLRWTPLSRLLSRRGSQNVVATIEPRGKVGRTVCLSAHLDTSRSGLMFHPRLARALGPWIALNSILVLAAAGLEPLAGRSRRVRGPLAAIRAALAAGAGILAERELRGVEVPGASDNASGCGVVGAVAARLAATPPESTRIVLLLTGCEEAGTLGMRAFLERHDTDGWLFVNVDNVGGPGTVRYLRREGVILRWPADPKLIAAVSRVADQHPELGLTAEDSPAGLTYDSSPVLAAGGRALTLSVQDGTIPNLHWPTDIYENVDRDAVRRTLASTWHLLQEVDRGAAD